MSLTDLHKYMAFNLFIQLKPIGLMRSFMKPYCNLCMEELLSIIKKLYGKKCHTTEQKNWKCMKPVGIKQLSVNFP